MGLVAELAIKIGASGGFEDGDVLHAFNRRRIRCVHAQHLCHVKAAGMTRAGRRRDGLAREWLERTKQYRFERVSTYEIERVVIATGYRERFKGVPAVVAAGPGGISVDFVPKGADSEKYLASLTESNSDDWYELAAMGDIDVPRYISRRLAHPRHAMFGSPGAEVWYGGRDEFGDAAMASIWAHIEGTTAYREAAFPLWPAGREDLEAHLFLSVDEMTDAEVADLESPLTRPVGDEVVVLRPRRRHVSWRNDAGLSGPDITQVEARGLSVDMRTRQPRVRAQIVRTRIDGGR